MAIVNEENFPQPKRPILRNFLKYFPRECLDQTTFQVFRWLYNADIKIDLDIIFQGRIYFRIFFAIKIEIFCRCR